jgi:predicted dehydrogenase
MIEPVRFTHDAQGRETQRVECDAEDTVYTSFATDAGVTGELMASWAGRGGPTILGAGDVFYASGGRVSGEEVTFEDGTTADLANLYEKGCPAERKAKDFPLGLTDTFALAQYEWLQAVRERRQPETSGRDALTNLSCAFAVLESAQAGRRVAIEEVASGRLCEYQRELDEHYHVI